MLSGEAANTWLIVFGFDPYLGEHTNLYTTNMVVATQF
jgi:hypothetical protein